jgi:hypothetical protein
MNRLSAVLALVVLSSCGHGSSAKRESAPIVQEVPSDTSGNRAFKGRRRPPTESEERIIKTLMAQTERVRELKFREPVPVVIEDRAAITSYIEGQIEDDSLERARTLYAALGLLRRDEDIRSLLLRVLGEQILGYYDPKEKRLVVREDIMKAMPEKSASGGYDEARVALVHELVHALQSQRLGLADHIDEKRDSDQDNAYRALIEGDASLAMIGYLLQEQQPDASLARLTADPFWLRSLSAMAEQLPLGEAELANAPEIVREPLLFAYIEGLAFASYIHARGGWKALDASYAKPPRSTKQIIHPELYFGPSKLVTIAVPELTTLSGAGFALAQEDTLGELEIGIFFGQALDQESSQRVASGWSGDRLRVYRNAAGDTPVVWFTYWESERHAEQAEQAANAVFHGQREISGDLVKVVRHGRAVLMLRLLPAALQEEPISAFRQWASATIQTKTSPRRAQIRVASPHLDLAGILSKYRHPRILPKPIASVK